MYIYTIYTKDTISIYICINTYIQAFWKFHIQCIYTLYIQKLYISYIQIWKLILIWRNLKRTTLEYVSFATLKIVYILYIYKISKSHIHCIYTYIQAIFKFHIQCIYTVYIAVYIAKYIYTFLYIWYIQKSVYIIYTYRHPRL